MYKYNTYNIGYQQFWSLILIYYVYVGTYNKVTSHNHPEGVSDVLNLIG